MVLKGKITNTFLGMEICATDTLFFVKFDSESLGYNPENSLFFWIIEGFWSRPTKTDIGHEFC